MLPFLFKGFIGLFLFACFYVSRGYKDQAAKRLHPKYVWGIFLDRVHYYLKPERIVVEGGDQERYIPLWPGRYYDIYCEKNSNLTLTLEKPNQIYQIKRIHCDLSKIVIKSSHPTENKVQVKINSVTLVNNSVLSFASNIDPKIDDDKIPQGSCIVYNFKSWEDLKEADLSCINGMTQELEQLIKS